MQVTFHGRVTCQFAPLSRCDLHENDMSRKKRDAFRCTGAGFRESDTFVSVFHWDKRLESRVFWGVACGRAIGVCLSGCGIEALFS